MHLQRSKHHVTAASLRAEGVLEIGRATDTSVLFVRTRLKLHLIHMANLPDRQLDDYAVRLAVTWIEDQGLPSIAVAKNLGVTQETLRKALAAAGFERLTPMEYQQRKDARSQRGNRRGRLVRTSPYEGTNT